MFRPQLRLSLRGIIVIGTLMLTGGIAFAAEAPLDYVREALGLSRDQFMQDYGGFLSACADLRKRGEDPFFAA
jgi:hypothetical protein